MLAFTFSDGMLGGGGVHAYLLNHGGSFYLSFHSVGGFHAKRGALQFVL